MPVACNMQVCPASLNWPCGQQLTAPLGIGLRCLAGEGPGTAACSLYTSSSLSCVCRTSYGCGRTAGSTVLAADEIVPSEALHATLPAFPGRRVLLLD